MKTKRIGNRFVTLAVALAAVLLGAPGARAAPLMLDVRSENRTVLVPGPGDGTIQIQVIAPDAPAIHTDRPRLNLALVVDRSGSMAEARKLDFVKTAAHHLVDMMGPDDLLSIVTYSQQVQVPWPSRPVGRDREELHRIVSGLYPGGSTFLSGGLEEGFRQAKAGKRRGTLNRVLLLSDGLANVGVTHRGALRERAGEMAEHGVSVSTFGVGNDFDEELMTRIAGGGGGITATSAIPSGSWRRWNPSSTSLRGRPLPRSRSSSGSGGIAASARSSGATGDATATPTSSGWAIFRRASAGPSSPS